MLRSENNFYGTRSIADAACKVGAGRFVMISSDKAVRPSSVMGATKRLAELYTQYLTGRSDTVFSMVRFGNVLGSACSVLPIWSEQLSRGGPITVTHPGMTRYFMTIPEAAGLVIQSAVYAGGAGGGEVFLLDMGQPIRIVELAERFVRSQGMQPGYDIAIEFTGIRPGEKLFEELAYESEEMIPTPHPSVRMWKTARPDAMRMRHVIAAFDRLRGYADGKGRHHWQDVTRDQLLEVLHSAVPEMVRPAGETAVPGVSELRKAV
ncbi:MAG: polysaccharide biosynthesis protein [Phycisphaerales bacterium]|nr:polysaccharide biosynthesis protein [Phycisphaerales bacterium]